MQTKQLCTSIVVVLMITVLAGLSTAQVPSPTLTLQLASGTTVRTIPDNGCDPVSTTVCDQDPTAGNIRFVGLVGSYNTNISVGNSIPALIDLGSTDSSRTSGSLTITLAQKGVNVPAAPQTLITSLSGGFSGPAGSTFSATFLAGANAGNASPLDYSPAVIPSGSVCVGDVAGDPNCSHPLGPFTTSSFNSGGSQTFTTSGGPFSTFNQANITVGGCTSASACRVNFHHSTAVMGYVAVAKKENGSDTLTPSQGSGYVFQLRQGASASASGTILESQEAYSGNPTLIFTSQLTPGVTYNMCERLNTNVLGVNWSISFPVPYNPALDDLTSCVDFAAQGGTTVVIGADNQLAPPKVVAGNITVKKVTVPSGSSESFRFSSNYGANFLLTHGQSNKSAPLNPATYSVSETTSAGWDQTSAMCDNGSSPSAISLTAAQTVTCTFTNTQRGHIIVTKVTNPGGSTQSFAFTAGWGSFNLTDGVSSDSGPIVPGTYSVSESAVTGWDQTSATCNNGSALNAITVTAGETVTCTFTNTQRGHIIVKNATNPGGSSQSFAVAASWGSVNLTGGGSTDSGPIAPGTYSMSETAVLGWDQTSATCDNGGNPGSITLAAGQTVTCTFTNTQRGHIIVKKVTNPSGGTQVFAFTAGWGSFSLTGGGSSDSGPIVPGNYSVSESPLSGWTQTSATCDNGNNPGAITLAPGKIVTCTFVNTIVIHPAATLATQSVTPGTSVYPGTPVKITVRETNTGDSTITNVNLTGTGCASWVPASVASLAAGAFADFSCTFAPMATTAWSATSHGKDVLGNDVPPTTTSGTVTILPDTPPVCKVYDYANPPYMSYQATGSGIVKLTVTTNLYNNFNVTVTPTPDAFSPAVPGQPYPVPAGTVVTFNQPVTSLIKVSAVRINTSKSAQLVVQATDAAGKSVSCDPIQTTLTRLKQDAGVQTFTQVPGEEHFVRIENGGLRRVDVIVNNVIFKVKRLGDDEIRVVDIQSAMVPGNGNTITLVPRGQKGESADVTIGPTP